VRRLVRHRGWRQARTRFLPAHCRDARAGAARDPVPVGYRRRARSRTRRGHAGCPVVPTTGTLSRGGRAFVRCGFRRHQDCMKRFALILLPLLAFAAGAVAMAGWHNVQARRALAHHDVTLDGARMFAPAPESVADASSNADDDASSSGLLSDNNWPDNAPTPEQVIYAQSDLLHREIAKLKPRTPGKVNLYTIVFAGDGSQNVFRNEAEYFDKLFSNRLGADGHVLVLENNPSSLTTRPLATWSNLEDALDAVAAKMDPQQDILLVYFTTHGSEDHTLLVDMNPLPLDQIGASDLPGILAEHPFKYKVMIVNACYSG